MELKEVMEKYIESISQRKEYTVNILKKDKDYIITSWDKEWGTHLYMIFYKKDGIYYNTMCPEKPLHSNSVYFTTRVMIVTESFVLNNDLIKNEDAKELMEYILIFKNYLLSFKKLKVKTLVGLYKWYIWERRLESKIEI